jgi:hypothetical protein
MSHRGDFIFCSCELLHVSQYREDELLFVVLMFHVVEYLYVALYSTGSDVISASAEHNEVSPVRSDL